MKKPLSEKHYVGGIDYCPVELGAAEMEAAEARILELKQVRAAASREIERLEKYQRKLWLRELNR